MAYLTSLNLECRLCSKRATVELFGGRNEGYGVYCAKHGAQRLKEVLEKEKQLAKIHSPLPTKKVGFGTDF